MEGLIGCGRRRPPPQAVILAMDPTDPLAGAVQPVVGAMDGVGDQLARGMRGGAHGERDRGEAGVLLVPVQQRLQALAGRLDQHHHEFIAAQPDFAFPGTQG